MDLKKKTGGLRGVRGMWSKEKSNVRVTGRFYTCRDLAISHIAKHQCGSKYEGDVLGGFLFLLRCIYM